LVEEREGFFLKKEAKTFASAVAESRAGLGGVAVVDCVHPCPSQSWYD
jgi:hypothetical protein